MLVDLVILSKNVEQRTPIIMTQKKTFLCLGFLQILQLYLNLIVSIMILNIKLSIE
jgi:hypothetical protein